MDIFTYCRHAGISMHSFAALTDLRTDRLRNFALGRERPGPRVMGRIITASGGLIQPEDFIPRPTPTERNDVPLTVEFHDGGLPCGLSPPLVAAMDEFGNGAVYDRTRHLFKLGGRMLTAAQLIARANEKRRARGATPIFYPGIYAKPDAAATHRDDPAQQILKRHGDSA